MRCLAARAIAPVTGVKETSPTSISLPALNLPTAQLAQARRAIRSLSRGSRAACIVPWWGSENQPAESGTHTA